MALEEIRNERLKKLDALRKCGVQAYPATAARTHEIVAVIEEFSALESSKDSVTVVGRVLAKREHGGSAFVDVRDGTGTLQGLLKSDVLGEVFEQFLATVDIGDFVSLEGTVFTTQRGQKTVEAHSWTMLSKSLLPLPEKWHGLQDPEERYRKRYLDILMDPEVREIFIKKSLFWNSARAFLLKEKFLEVQTPVLEDTPGGADAEPFMTHLNALDIDLSLRISLELPLKKLLVAGYDKVFEIGRIFRNEGIDQEHLQDYTQLEFYLAYADYNDLMDFVQRMYQTMIAATVGDLKIPHGDTVIDWSGSWPKVSYYDIFQEHTGLDIASATDEKLIQYAMDQGFDPSKHVGRGRVTDLIFKKKVRPHIIQPIFLINPPVEVEPLAKRLPSDPGRVERMQVVAVGTELGKGFSELNDPIDQRERFEEQMCLREAGDAEAQQLDESFLEALEYGMPPAAGFGFSERLFSFIVGKSVRETSIFPLLKPK